VTADRLVLGGARLGERDVDVLMEGELIAAIDETGSLGTPDVDLAGRWLGPGLWDEHTHFTQWALTSQRLDLSTAASARDAAAAVAAAIESGAASEAGQLIGAGFRDGMWPDAPNLADLDAASGDIPVVLVSGDLHCVWLNSAALAVHGHAGHPTGLIREDAAFEISTTIAAVPDELGDAWARAAASAAARRGVVGIVDLEMSWNLGTWTRRRAAGHDAVRVEFGIYTQHLQRAIDEGLRTGQRVDELITVGRFKVLTDGSLNTRTAYCYDEYPGLEGQELSRGMLTLPPDELVPLMRLAHEHGIVPDVHAIGDHANSLVLDAFETVGQIEGAQGGRVEHAQLLAERDIPRYAELGVEISVQPEHLVDDRDVTDRYWPGRTGRAYAFRSLLDAGARLRFGSDAPVAPLDPWVTIAAAVTRTRDGREPWHPEQRITVAEALEASTRTTVEVGQLADLVVTEADPFATDPDALRTMPVAATLLGGRFTHREL
jgi:predicted amidohydrolase YtcJ